MTYFFALFLGATIPMLPWLIIALALGTAVSVSVSLMLRERPDRQLRRSLRSLQSRLALLLDIVAAGLATGQFNEPGRRRLRGRLAQVNQTTLTVASQLPGLDSQDVPAGIDAGELALRLFDVELAAEHLAGSWTRAAASDTGPSLSAGSRDALAEAVGALRAGLRYHAAAGQLAHAQTLAERMHATPPTPGVPGAGTRGGHLEPGSRTHPQAGRRRRVGQSARQRRRT